MTDKREPATISDMEEGLRFIHALMSVQSHIGQEGACYAQALAGLLLDKGVITPEEFEAKLAEHRKDMADLPRVNLAKGPEKYTCEEVIIDCAARLHLCRATCCTFRFFIATQDLDEGIVKWDYGNPYWIRQREDGYCVHCDPEGLTCQIHEHRPYTCRFYDCRKDQRIWLDFEQKIPNPDLAKDDGRAA